MILYEKHKETIEKAIDAINHRTFFAAYPESPKAYGDEGQAKAQAWLDELSKTGEFTELLQTDSTGFMGEEASPYTQQPLNIKYPAFSVEQLTSRAEAAMRDWRRATPETRAAVLVESLERIQKRFFDIAVSTMHTSGQPYMMSFQASGPHASDRALEAVAMGYDMQKRFPMNAEWEKPMGKFNIKVKKTWRAVGRGVALVIGCSTFPVWNTVPGLYASLITGNPVIVKPHAGAVLPIAVVVAELQKALKENGFNPDVAQLAADTTAEPITKQLAEHKLVKLIDYTGNTQFGDYIEAIPGKTAFTEKAGVNSVILDSVTDLNAVMQNLAFSACLYSGQMCTAPQNIFIPQSGLKVGEENVPFETVVNAITDAIKAIASHPKMGPGVLGAIQNPNTCRRIEDSKELDAKVLLESMPLANEEFPQARTATPIVLQVDAEKRDIYAHELFGPIVLIVKTDDTKHSVALAKELASEKGAISCGAWTTDAETKKFIAEEMEEAFTPVAFNLTGQIWMNQNAAFSDFHVTGGNPAGNATFTDAAYIVRRFVWVGHKEAGL